VWYLRLVLGGVFLTFAAWIAGPLALVAATAIAAIRMPLDQSPGKVQSITLSSVNTTVIMLLASSAATSYWLFQYYLNGPYVIEALDFIASLSVVPTTWDTFYIDNATDNEKIQSVYFVYTVTSVLVAFIISFLIFTENDYFTFAFRVIIKESFWLFPILTAFFGIFNLYMTYFLHLEILIRVQSYFKFIFSSNSTGILALVFAVSTAFFVIRLRIRTNQLDQKKGRSCLCQPLEKMPSYNSAKDLIKKQCCPILKHST
jgi:hypothetical protein